MDNYSREVTIALARMGTHMGREAGHLRKVCWMMVRVNVYTSDVSALQTTGKRRSVQGIGAGANRDGTARYERESGARGSTLAQSRMSPARGVPDGRLSLINWDVPHVMSADFNRKMRGIRIIDIFRRGYITRQY